MSPDPTEAALRAAVVAEPADHVRRLAYADHLDETPDWAVCDRCMGAGHVRAVNEPRKDGRAVHKDDEVACPRCLGKGWASPRVERAEFIRAQVELASYDSSYFLSFDSVYWQERSAIPLVKRAAELVHYAWADELRSYAVKDPLVFNHWEFRAGFPERISAPLHEWWGPSAHVARWRATYPVTHAHLDGIWPAGFGAALEVMFCRDFESTPKWRGSDGRGLPADLYDRLTGFDRISPGQANWSREAKIYGGEAPAMAALMSVLEGQSPCTAK